MVKEICNALLEADVNVKLVSTLRKSIKNTVNFKDLPPAVNKKRLIQKAVFDELVKLVDVRWPSRIWEDDDMYQVSSLVSN